MKHFKTFIKITKELHPELFQIYKIKHIATITSGFGSQPIKTLEVACSKNDKESVKTCIEFLIHNMIEVAKQKHPDHLFSFNGGIKNKMTTKEKKDWSDTEILFKLFIYEKH